MDNHTVNATFAPMLYLENVGAVSTFIQTHSELFFRQDC
jgi:hypothetical protein